jgi:hypothetical protein
MEEKPTYTVTEEDNTALLKYISSSLLDFSSVYQRKHFSYYADNHEEIFGKKKSCKRIILQKTLSNWLIRGRGIPNIIIKKHNITLIQSAQYSLQLYHNAKSDVDNSSTSTTTTTTTTPSKSTPRTMNMNFQSPGGAIHRISNPDHATFNCGELQVDVEYQKNLQGVVAVIIPACPEISSKGPVGAMDKLLLEIPMYDIRAKHKYKGWLQPEGKGIFLEMPATGTCLFTERASHFNINKQFPADQDKFEPRCQRTWDAYERMMEGKTDEVHNTMTVYWELPKDIILSNAHFNKDENEANQPNPLTLQRKMKPLKMWVIPPNTTASTDSGKAGTYQVVGTIYFEAEIINKHNIASSKKLKNTDDLSSDLAGLSIG